MNARRPRCVPERASGTFLRRHLLSPANEAGIFSVMRKDPIQKSTSYADIVGTSVAAAAFAVEKDPSSWDRDTVAKLAYRLWEDRGRPEGSPESDWYHAEELLRSGL